MDKLLISASLTIRELGVIRLAKEGHSNKEIAQILKIEETTVKWPPKKYDEKIRHQRKASFCQVFTYNTTYIRLQSLLKHYSYH